MVGLGFEPRALHLWSRCSTAWAIPPVLLQFFKWLSRISLNLSQFSALFNSGCWLFLLFETMPFMYSSTLLYVHSYSIFLLLELESQKEIAHKMLEVTDELSSQILYQMYFNSQSVFSHLYLDCNRNWNNLAGESGIFFWLAGFSFLFWKRLCISSYVY
jgi:hypothetical protein